jgi:hypothetical protein
MAPQRRVDRTVLRERPRMGRPDSDAITPEGDPDRVFARPGKGCAGGALSRGRAFRRAEAWGRRLLRRLGSRRSPSGAALARGARPSARSRRRAERGKPCAGCYRDEKVGLAALRS